MLRRVLRIWIWGAGVSYLASLGVLAWFILDGAVIRQNPACERLDLGVALYWLCTDDRVFVQFLSNLTNVVLTTTMWAPPLIATAIHTMQDLRLALFLILANTVGITTALLVLVRTMRIALRTVSTAR